MTPEELTEIRHKLGWTKVRLAKELGTTDRTIRRWESGGAPISKMVESAVRMIAERHGLPSKYRLPYARL